MLVRHGESVWNQQNLFCGWVDVDLSEKGAQDAIRAGQLLKQEGFRFDQAFCSMLKRSIRTLWLIEEQLDQMWLPVEYSWRLNERHYGGLAGLNRAETAKKFGEEQVEIWRRSYSVRPPQLPRTDTTNPALDKRYDSLKPSEIPYGECLADTLKRTLPFWKKTILPAIRREKKILIVAHGNSLRALVKELDNLSDNAIAATNIPMGFPLVYELNSKLKPIQHYYLGDPKEIELVIEGIKRQGKSKQ